jgi:hypothetical protein
VAGVTGAIKGSLLIACSCDYGCPCNVNGRPTSGDCEGGWTWHIDSGRFDDTELGGLNFSIFADWPGAIHEGGGKAVAFLDDEADAAQQEALAAIIRGEAGGPWAVFLTTYQLEGPYPAHYAVELDGEHSSYRVGDAAELELEPIRNPVTGAEVHPRLLLPEGMLTKEVGLFASRTFRVKRGVNYDHSGRYAAVGAFDYPLDARAG